MSTYAEHLAFKERRIASLRLALSESFPPQTPITVEFGCGHGHWLTAYAEAHPEKACLGVDLVTQRIRKAQAKRDKRNLAHLHFLKAEAGELLAAWPADRPPAEVFMLFPDPWPKARHHKHRMIQPALLDRLAELMPRGARFHFRTDHTDYFEWTREHFSLHPGWRIDPEALWPWETESYFQKLMDSWQSLVAERVAPTGFTTSSR